MLAKELHLEITDDIEMLLNEDSPIGSRQIVQKSGDFSKHRQFTFSDLTSFTPKLDS